MMVEVIKARLNVSLDNPCNTCEVFLHLRKCCRELTGLLNPYATGHISQSLQKESTFLKRTGNFA